MAEDQDFDNFENVNFESVVDADTAAKAVEKLGAGESEPPPQISDPDDGPVTLPAGFRRLRGTSWTDVRTAWVRELTGHHEERIARARLRDDPETWVQTVLECGVEKLGDEVPTKDDFNMLVLGDRDYLLLEIARATYGDQIEYEAYTCQFCQETFGLSLSLSEDIVLKRLGSVDEATFEVKLRKDRVAVMSLPTVEVAPELNRADTPAEMNTSLLTHAIQEIRGPNGTQQVAGDKDVVLSLGAQDRQTLIREMSQRMPGPRYTDVRFNHEPGCGEENRLVITMADLFRGM